MENLEWIFSTIITVLGFLAALIPTVIKLTKSLKAKKILEQTTEVCDLLLPFIEEAERLLGFEGAEKKAYVLQKAKQYAEEKEFDSLDEEMLSYKIDAIVDITKKVNIK